jgi:hypothetical protein
MLTGLKHPEACFLSRIKAFIIEHRGTKISGAPLRVGMMRQPIYTPSCSTETMAVLSPMTPRTCTWGWSRVAAVRRRDGWTTRGVCLCARRSRMRSTTRLGAFGVNRCRCIGARWSDVRRQWQWLRRGKGWLRISLFCSEDCRLRCEMVKFAQSIGIENQ